MSLQSELIQIFQEQGMDSSAQVAYLMSALERTSQKLDLTSEELSAEKLESHYNRRIAEMSIQMLSFGDIPSAMKYAVKSLHETFLTTEALILLNSGDHYLAAHSEGKKDAMLESAQQASQKAQRIKGPDSIYCFPLITNSLGQDSAGAIALRWDGVPLNVLERQLANATLTAADRITQVLVRDNLHATKNQVIPDRLFRMRLTRPLEYQEIITRVQPLIVLYIDMVGSTRLTSYYEETNPHAIPEFVGSVNQRILELFAGPRNEANMFMETLIGDGATGILQLEQPSLMAKPASHFVNAGIAFQQEVRDPKGMIQQKAKELGIDPDRIAYRVAIHTGQGRLASVHTLDGKTKLTSISSTMNKGARIESVAKPNLVTVSQEFLDLCKAEGLEPLIDETWMTGLKGFSGEYQVSAISV